jgi:hypothetical protein
MSESQKEQEPGVHAVKNALPAPTPEPASPKPWWGVREEKLIFFGVEVGGWGALLALGVSLFTLGYTAYDKWVAKPDPEFWGPEEINLNCWDDDTADDTTVTLKGCDDGDFTYLLANPISFLNHTGGDHPFNVRTMDVAVDFRDAADKPVKQICLDWQYFSGITTVGAKEDPAAPFEVTANTPFAREVEFYPRRKVRSDGTLSLNNRLPFRDLEKEIGDGDISSIVLTFEAALLDAPSPMTVSCSVLIDSDFKANAASHEFEFYARECLPTASLAPRCQ